jgi:hypothetical protein
MYLYYIYIYIYTGDTVGPGRYNPKYTQKNTAGFTYAQRYIYVYIYIYTCKYMCICRCIDAWMYFYIMIQNIHKKIQLALHMLKGMFMFTFIYI